MTSLQYLINPLWEILPLYAQEFFSKAHGRYFLARNRLSSGMERREKEYAKISVPENRNQKL